MTKTPVHELYVAIQAEGSRAGRPTVVVRTGVFSVKVVGAMLGNPAFTPKKPNTVSRTSLKFTTKTLKSKK